jgi:hypothetical protein
MKFRNKKNFGYDIPVYFEKCIPLILISVLDRTADEVYPTEVLP